MFTGEFKQQKISSSPKENASTILSRLSNQSSKINF